MNGVANQADWTSAEGAHNALSFLVNQILSGVWTVTVVKVINASNSGAVALAGTVDVQPLVNQIDGAGNATPHGVINGLIYFRAQGGANAVILDPVVGDIGIAIFASRDISVVKNTKAQANPGSFRRFDPADGIYLGGLLNGIPTQWVQFIGAKIIANAVTELDLTIGGATVLAVTSGGVAVTGTFMVNGVDVGSMHAHTGVTTGSGDTGPPV